MAPQQPLFDLYRDADRYRRLTQALRHASEAIAGLEMREQPDMARILTTLLPDLAAALDAELAFVTQVPTHLAGPAPETVDHAPPEVLELISVYPAEAASARHLPLSDLMRAVLEKGEAQVYAPLVGDEPTLLAGLEIFKSTSAVIAHVQTVTQRYLVGVCNKRNMEDSPFLTYDRITLHNLLQLVAVGTRLSERRQQELDSSQKVLAAVSSELNLAELLPLVSRGACTVVNADAAGVMLWNQAGDALVFQAGYGLSDDYLARQQIPRSRIVELLKAEAGQHYIADLQTDPVGEQALVTSEGLRSVLSTPLRLNGRVTGVLNIYSKTEVREFGEFERRLAMVLADEAAIAVKNAQAFKRRLDEQAAIQQISLAATSGDSQQVWRVIAQTAISLADADGAMLMTVDENAALLRAVGTWDARNGRWVPQQNLTLSLDDNSMIGHVALNKEPYYLPDVNAPGAHYSPTHNLLASIGGVAQSAYCVPLVAQDKTLGTLYVYSRELDGVSLEEQRFVAALMPHAAVALLNARLLEDAERETQRRKRLIDVQKRVIDIQQGIADVLSWEKQISQIRQALEELFDTSGFFIATYDEATAQIDLPKVYDRGKRVPDDDPRRQPGDVYGPRKLGDRHGLVDHVIRTKQSVLVRNFQEHPLWHDIDDMYKAGIQSFLVAPMRIGDRVTGTIGLRSYKTPGAYSEYDELLLNRLADTVATVLENARSYDQRLREVQSVSHFQQLVSEIDVGKPTRDDSENGRDHLAPANGSVVDREIRNIYRFAQEAMGPVQLHTADMVICLYDAPTRQLRFPLVYEDGQDVTTKAKELTDLTEPYRAYRTRTVGSYPDLIDWLIVQANKDALLFPTRDEMDAWREAHSDVRFLPQRSQSWLGATMMIGSKVMGVIALRHFAHEHAFEERHMRLIQTIAGQAAIVIENARLYERTVSGQADLMRSNTIALMGAWGADVVHEINREVGHIRRALIRLGDKVINYPEVYDMVVPIVEEIDQRIDELASPEWLEEAPPPGHLVDDKFLAHLDRMIDLEVDRMRDRHPLIHFETDLNCPNMAVLMHEKWLRRTVRHFLNNGAQSMSQNMPVRDITVKTWCEDNWIHTTVTDTGKGIRPEVRDALFKMPVQHAPEDDRARSGRGLLLVAHVMDAHRGEVRLEWSEVGGGSCFRFSLPALVKKSEE